MALDRWIALVLLLIFAVYGYTAFFTMDGGPAAFHAAQSGLAEHLPQGAVGHRHPGGPVRAHRLRGKTVGGHRAPEIDYRRLTDYKLGQALILLSLMVAYALLLRPLGFILSSSLFLILSAAVLGERKWLVLVPVVLATSVGVWYLVQQVLGIFLRPLPFFVG